MAELTHLERKQQISRVLIITLVLNVIVAGAKLAYGYASGSLSVLADGFHSLMDSTSNIIGLVAIHFAYNPPDEEHHYGHRKAEILASLMIAMLLAVTSLEIVKELVGRLFKPETPEVSLWGFGIMFVGLMINLVVVSYESRAGKRLNSPLLLSDSQHTRSDVLVTISVMASMGAIALQWYWLDSVVSLGIIAVIGRMAYVLFRQNIDILLDRSPVVRQEIQTLVETMPGVRRCHKVRAHGSPDEIWLELHIWVDPRLSVLEAHTLAHGVKDGLIAQHPEFADVTIHVEPDERQVEEAGLAINGSTE
ncbi:MAG: cation transporter [Candidatus Melainabacteria bacterium HGW-Melainabacteria-1]|nr:MAG: cation transporter [Candidatus Melainabacteria bacterium HGW-Melainabacteria-1]